MCSRKSVAKQLIIEMFLFWRCHSSAPPRRHSLAPPPKECGILCRRTRNTVLIAFQLLQLRESRPIETMASSISNFSQNGARPTETDVDRRPLTFLLIFNKFSKLYATTNRRDHHPGIGATSSVACGGGAGLLSSPLAPIWAKHDRPTDRTPFRNTFTTTR